MRASCPRPPRRSPTRSTRSLTTAPRPSSRAAVRTSLGRGRFLGLAAVALTPVPGVGRVAHDHPVPPPVDADDEARNRVLVGGPLLAGAAGWHWFGRMRTGSSQASQPSGSSSGSITPAPSSRRLAIARLGHRARRATRAPHSSGNSAASALRADVVDDDPGTASPTSAPVVAIRWSASGPAPAVQRRRLDLDPVGQLARTQLSAARAARAAAGPSRGRAGARSR